MLSFLTVVLALASATAVLASRTSPPKGALVVGKGGQYETIQAAVDALQPTEKEQIIFIYPGTYYEQVSIKSLPGPLKIYGYTTHPGSYAANQATIVAGHSQKDKRTNDLTATLRVATSHFRLYNVNVINNFGEGSQALALSAKNTDQGYYACSFIGYQDTVLSQEPRQLFHHCHIQGATDFIFGQRGRTWFEKGTISVLPVKTGYVTASGRASDDSDSYYVFNRTRIEPAPGANVKKGSYFLSRPWASYARLAFQYCWMSDVINGSGWHVWKAGDERIDHVSFGEFQNKGPGALGERAWFAKKLKKGLEIGDILGEDHESAYYFDSSFVASDSEMTIGDKITRPPPLPRILCLHGGGVNGRVFRLQCRTIISQLAHAFRLVFMDGPYASSPHPDIVAVYGHLGPFHHWLPPTDEEKPTAGAGARHVMDSCLAAMENDDDDDDDGGGGGGGGSGPWVGVLGFSQGAKIAISLLWAQRRAEVLLGPGHARTDFRFGVIMAGSAPVVCLDPRLPRPRHVADATANVSGPSFEDWPDAPCGHHVVDVPTLHVHGLKDAGIERHRKLLALYCEPGRTSVVEWDAGHRLPFKTGDVQRVVSSMLDMARQAGVV